MEKQQLLMKSMYPLEGQDQLVQTVTGDLRLDIKEYA